MSPFTDGERSDRNLVFSDSDLKRWKADLAKVKDKYAFLDVKALLARLENSETALTVLRETHMDCTNDECAAVLNKWEESKGVHS